jgi:hypothetical protein
LIGGTSTGAIIAAGLAIGMSISAIADLYEELANSIFRRRRAIPEYARFDATYLENALKRVFGEVALGDAHIQTGLCIVTKRVDTRSTWPLTNNPRSKYYEYNKSILLRNALRASTAAPTYFEPERLEVRPGEYGAFVDGGASMAGNPALQLFLIATLSGFMFNWPTGEERLLLVSVGTGLARPSDTAEAVLGRHIWSWASSVPGMLIEDANWQNQLLLQYLSRSRTPWPIDDEVGDLSRDLLPSEPSLTYLRYDAWLDARGLTELGLPELIPKQLAHEDLASTKSMGDLARVGQRAAESQVHEHDFPAVFDLPAGG